jgi:hypothetical protein
VIFTYASLIAELVEGKSPSVDPSTYKFTFDTSKMKRILDISCHTKEESVRDILDDFKKRGWKIKADA